MIRTTAAFAFLLASCSASPSEVARENAKDPAIDPAVAQAMAGPVMSDMQMSGEASPDALTPGEQPATLPVPNDARIDTAGAPTLGVVVAAVVREPAFAGCNAEIGYSAMWSVKLPVPLVLPSAARLAEAAGSERAGCALRVVRFAMPDPPVKVRSDYAALAKRAGFVARAVGDGVSASRVGDGMAFHITTVPSKDGTRVDLVTRSR